MTDLSRWNPFKFNRKNNKRIRTTEDNQQIARREQWDDPFERVEQQMNSMLRSFFGDDWFMPAMRSASQNPSFFGNFSPSRFSPSVDVTNEGNYLVVSAELPGMEKDDVEVTLDDGVLTFRGEKRHERESDEDGCYRTERFYGTWQRSVPLPGDVDTNAAEAHFDKGVLTVKFPQLERTESGPRRLEF